MTNFDFLKKDKRFGKIAEVAQAAETLLHIDVDSCVLNCRRAMEFAVKWMYSADRELTQPYQDTLVAMMNDEKFKEIVGNDIWKRMEFIRKVGNNAAHGGKKITVEQAEQCLENLYYFLDEVAYYYSDAYESRPFDRSLLRLTPEEALSFIPSADVDIKALIEENRAMKAELSARRAEHQQTYVQNPPGPSEYATRKIYIEFMLEDAGWTEDVDWKTCVELHGPTGGEEAFYADHVLYGDDGRPLALLEAKRTCLGLSEGRRRAELYADALEKEYGRRPVVFLSNGFDTYILDGVYPERKVASVYSKRDLERIFKLRERRIGLDRVFVNKSIAGRYYQEAAVKAVCAAFGKENRRKALLVMAAGSGKTRTVIELCDILVQHGRAKNVLYLADRRSLVTQAKRSFERLLPELSTTDLCEEGFDPAANCAFSTYREMTELIDTAKDGEGRLFTAGCFDLVICDGAHRSVCGRYRDLLNYFDALLVGLTDTPEKEAGKAVSDAFELENGVPTYVYSLSKAVSDGYLVDFMTVETHFGYPGQTTVYDELSDADKEEYENRFGNGEDRAPEKESSSAFDEWLFAEDTVKEVLRIVMEHGLKVDRGRKLGKTIIFAKNHAHAEKILDVFQKTYKDLPGFAAVIDDRTDRAQSVIDAFSDPAKLPQIAVSVDELDTGIDVPEVLNLVFFKRVLSKAKFRQMLGRGARICPTLMDGKDKDEFYIFDFCGNLEFFRMNSERSDVGMPSLSGRVFALQARIAFLLGEEKNKTKKYAALRSSLVAGLAGRVDALDRENFAVRQHLKYVERYSDPESCMTLTDEELTVLTRELAPLMSPDGEEEEKALFLDALIYGAMLARLEGREYGRLRDGLDSVSRALADAAVPKTGAQSELIRKTLREDFWDAAEVRALEEIRKKLRGLMKYLPDGFFRRDVRPDGGRPGASLSSK